MEWFRQAGRAAADQLESMPPVARWTLISLVAALLVGAVLLSKSSQLGGGTYLFREPLPASQLPAVEAALAKAGLKDFQWEGQRLLVPSAFKDRYLAALLDADVPPRDFGQLLDAAIEAGSPFESREQKTQRIRNARQRVLAQIIAEMKGVESARVLYDQGDAGGIRGGKILTASVSVTCDGNQSLSLKQVRAIRNLVASAIAGLEVHQVSVTDLNTGRNYAGVKFVDPRWLAELRDEHQKRLEQDWRQDILARIDWIVGVNANVKVRLRQETSPDEEGDPQWQPAEIKVNLLVPQAYVIKVWRQRYHIPDDDRAPITPSRDVTELARELAVHLKSHVADMVPSGVDLDLEISLQDDLAAKGEDAAT
ncbi:MAG: hypothetical protein GTO53_04810, partial [Planctomycetales bacterium]|nr:hypothetical protein [Planctomycetales bacterium]NIM08475.1 hypothetical protein [Planctomycetales bacterium]NIN07955.1 hypothetical protein [Planctomycetales bacterium]NIN77083.1 hypothetical protein [Planctomycetales bacterium]NIO34261.1 hypothetical protein [Planctomycetales bacterium]